ncbi:MAG: EVE domain-containing protein [Abditibacteriaceae bacterium]
MAIWLLKTEPTVYSYADLERDGETIWDGVTNNTALKNIRSIEKGDIAIIYHTRNERAAIGIADVSRGYYVNPNFNDPRLAVCDVKAKRALKRPITLAECKAEPRFEGWDLIRLGRLSVVPVSAEQWRVLLEMEKQKL